ncbi:MAG TPA: hypothetical protein VM677_16215 [Actinokineospora sp.]|nr:hypothetical protein [Actinokineospora sp.]
MDSQLWTQATSARVREPGDRGNGVLVAQGEGEIADLAHLLEVDNDAEAFACMCTGDLEFVVHGPSTETLVLHLDGSLDQDGQRPLIRRAELVWWLISQRLVSPAGSRLDREFWGLAPNVEIVLLRQGLPEIVGRFARAHWSVRTRSRTAYEIVGEWAHLLLSISDDNCVLSGLVVPDRQTRLREVLAELELLP